MGEIAAAYCRGWIPTLPVTIVLAILVVLAAIWVRRRPPAKLTFLRLSSAIGLVVALGLALFFAWRRMSLLDDAFISFRYARNLVDGHGLVFNVGERVEGYTNFLWTILLAGLAWLTGVEIPYLALGGCLVCLVGNLTTVWLIGRRLSAPEPNKIHVPLAALWLAVQYSFTGYGTTGMETMLASWLVNLGVLALLARPRPAAAFASGCFLILAAFARPDHGLYYALMGAVLALDHLRRLREPGAWRAAIKECALFAAPFTAYLGFLWWKWFYYGDLLPNTFYVNSAASSYWPQGARYGLATLLGAHLVWLLPLFMIWLVSGRDAHGRIFKPFAGLAVTVYSLYVVKIGGDKMMGRFFITLLPLIALGVEQLAHRWARRTERRPAWAGVLATVVLVIAMHGVPLIPACRGRWGFADSPTLYRVHSLKPLKIVCGNSNLDRTRLGRMLKSNLVDKDLHPTISAKGMGIVAYYSQLPLIDRRGLTDRVIARQPLQRRGHPGHEKLGTQAYLDAREVRFEQRRRNKKFPYTAFSFDKHQQTFLRIYRYDAALLQAIKEKNPQFRYVDFRGYFDKNIETILADRPLNVARKLMEFDHYYFALQPDRKRRARLVRRFIRLWDFENERFPPGSRVEGDLAGAFLRPAADRQYQIENYQGETLLATGVRERGTVWLPPFVVTGDMIGFCLGGGNDGRLVEVQLQVDGRIVRRHPGNGRDSLNFVVWNVQPWRGREARLILSDRSTQARLLFDMFFEANTQWPPADG
ncbi:MAG TPA: hypothetical protein PKW95_15460 [bacterium]|nr:hypothetical protein [bacterium]